MNRYCSTLFAVLAVGAGASFVHAETSYTIGDGKLTIAVPAGESNEISAAKFQEALAAEVTDIEMNGPGRLIVNQDTTAYTGTIHILGGTWRVVDSRGLGAVGTAPSDNNKYVASIAGAGNVYVAGGTLEAVSDTVNGIQYWGKVVYFEGTGQDGAGALVAKLGAAHTSVCVFSANLIMTGDATIANIGDYDCSTWATGVNLRMDGHTLTVKGSDNGAGFAFRETRLTNGEVGNLVQESGRLCYRAFNQVYSSTAYHYINGDAHLDLCDKFGGLCYRKLVWNSTGVNDWTSTRSPTKNVWSAPIELKQDMTLLGTAVLSGTISGEGGLVFKGGALPNTACVELQAANTFKGALTAENTTLKLSANALSSSQSAFVATDTKVELLSDAASMFPPATITVSEDQTASVTGGAGSWTTKLEKRGEGTLDYASSIGAETLVLKGGAMKLRSKSVLENPAAFGLVEGYGYYPTAASAYNAAIGREVFRDTIVPALVSGKCEVYYGTTEKKKCLSWFPEISGGWYDKNTNPSGTKANWVLTYTGYIWNHSDEAVTWSFGGNFCGQTLLYIGDTLVFKGTSTSKTQHGNVTLQPGATPFYFSVACVVWDGGAGGNDQNWGGVGIRYDPQGRNTDYGRDYLPLVNTPGELPLLTWVKDNSLVEYPRGGRFFNYGEYNASYAKIAEIGPAAGYYVATASFRNLQSAFGAQLDLDGTSMALFTLTGVPEVLSDNCMFRVTDTWTVDAEALPIGGLTSAPLHVDSLQFGEQTELVISNPEATPAGRSWTLALSDTDIVGNLSLRSEDPAVRENWQLVVDDNSVVLKRIPLGMVIIVK